MDPYLNIDPGTMSPFQHGEVYVTEDGAETDLDLGYYERFTEANLSRLNSVSTGQIYHEVISRERRGGYLGRTVQVIPHITNEIKNRITKLQAENKSLDFILVEIGGTVGDIESVPFLEAIRQFKLEHGPENTLFIHLTLVPTITYGGEIKTKPTQHSVKELLKQGIQPDILICRSRNVLDDSVKEKISLFCNVQRRNVISAPDISGSIYEIPILYHNDNLDDEIIRYFRLEVDSPLFTGDMNPLLSKWQHVVNTINNPKKTVNIAVVGKYMSLNDSYRSLFEALSHGGIPHDTGINLIKIDSEEISDNNLSKKLSGINALLVPGGFGERGIEGKLKAIKLAREKKIPFFGICLGMQCMVIEFARNVAGLTNANSTEFNSATEYPVISLMDEQVGISNKGGTMRLGAFACHIARGTLLEKAYRTNEIQERHRHRFEFTNIFREKLEKDGLVISGTSPNGDLVETVELPTDVHPFFVGVQFHPEFKSKPLKPHPLFKDLIGAALEFKIQARDQ